MTFSNNEICKDGRRKKEDIQNKIRNRGCAKIKQPYLILHFEVHKVPENYHRKSFNPDTASPTINVQESLNRNPLFYGISYLPPSLTGPGVA